MPKPIIVLGSPRTGTSLLGQIVVRWGAYAGAEDEFRKGDEGNPDGYFEYFPLVELTQELIESAPVQPWHEEFHDIMRARANESIWRDRAVGLIDHMDGPGRIWVWKYPIMLLCIEFWRAILPSAIYVITVRNPLNASISYQKGVIPSANQNEVQVLSGTLALWQYYMATILDYTADADDKIFVSYEKIVQDPRVQCARLCRFLNQRAGIESVGDAQIEAMASCPKSQHWHNNDGRSLHEHPKVTGAQVSLYEALKKKIDDPRVPVDTTGFSLSTEMCEYLNNLVVLDGFKYKLQRQDRLLNSRSVRLALAANRVFRKSLRLSSIFHRGA